MPGGCHTNSKGSDRYPANAPHRIVRGKGGRVWADDGREFVDWSMGINNVLIGHAEDAIDDAAVAALRTGQSFGRPSDLEEQAAEAVLELFPHGEMIKFCKNGSDANNAAIRLARAITGRPHIAYDGAAPFLSTADWFVGGWPSKWAGTLDSDRAFALTFRFNDVDSLERCFATRPLAGVILELGRMERPTPAFLAALRELTKRHGTLLIVDEVVTGYRYALHGLCAEFSIDPDLFTLGKGIANGYSVAALCGKREYMQRGADDVFLLSTTNGAERSGLAAAIATAAFYQTYDVVERLAAVGEAFAEVVNREAHAAGVADRIAVRTEFACRPALMGDDATKRLFCETLIDHGVLVPPAWVCPCYRRPIAEVQQTEFAVGSACRRLAREGKDCLI